MANWKTRLKKLADEKMKALGLFPNRIYNGGESKHVWDVAEFGDMHYEDAVIGRGETIEEAVQAAVDALEAD